MRHAKKVPTTHLGTLVFDIIKPILKNQKSLIFDKI